ncbi:MAG TPA: glycosyltransferase [Candidatus Deferrimicrobium sp.]|nr:glycosyltransferase [Candidatus Deferrimicrobium sp.]
MTLLVVSPDYISHATPLLTIAGAWAERGERVVVATGPAIGPVVAAAGFEHSELIMSRGSNAGAAGAGRGSRAEARSLEAFFMATRRGMLETLRFQAEARTIDLLWQPQLVARRTIRIVERVRPDAILVDHLAFAATIGLRAMGAPYADVVVGHPTALPVGAETYGVPSSWPSAITADPVGLATLRAIARGVSEAFGDAYDRILRSLAPGSEPVGDAFAAHGDLVLYAYPAELHEAARTSLLPRHAFLGGAVRHESPDDETAAWLARTDGRPLVVVSLGTFLSARSDVLAQVAAALRRVEARVAIAMGSNSPDALGPVPSDWLVRASLPQVALLGHASLLVTHGGNNSVTEALAHGVPLLVMPFSSDQFDGAAAIERHLAGVALDPNRASRPLIAGSIRGLLKSPPRMPGRISDRLRALPGPDIAYAALSGGAHRPPQGASAPIPTTRRGVVTTSA